MKAEKGAGRVHKWIGNPKKAVGDYKDAAKWLAKYEGEKLWRNRYWIGPLTKLLNQLTTLRAQPARLLMQSMKG